MMTDNPAEALVLKFWQTVWNPPYDIAYIDTVVTDDFIITSAGKDIVSKTAFKTWVQNFQAMIKDLRLEPLDTFANASNTRVVSRWRITGFNRGLFGIMADNRPIELTGIAIWEIRDGKLAHNWVERSAFELYQTLRST